MEVKYDFSGYATKAGLLCTDGRTILPDAFKHQDTTVVPLVWAHLHKEPANILGKAILEHRDDGVYAYCKFNETEAGRTARELVKHGDITALSIYANQLKESAKKVIHGMIREVSLVLSGANPGALIDNLAFSHADGSWTGERDETEAIIYTGLALAHAEEEKVEELELPMEEETEEELVEHSAADPTVREVFDGMTEQQKTVVYAMLSSALDQEDTEEVEHSDEEDNIVKNNVFDKYKRTNQDEEGVVLSHDQMADVFKSAQKCGSFKDAMLKHATEWGIENIEVLFPDARNVRTTPDLVKRDDTWVAGVLSATHKTPFSRIRSMAADLTEDEARAKGYITGSKKAEQVFPVMKRITTPTTVYKKQKLDRDNIIDITDFDVVAWIRAEMQVLLKEEVARAMLIGDGRPVTDPDHINTENIRPIWRDDDFYAYKVKWDADISTINMIDEIVRARKHYKGTGYPTLYTTIDVVTDMLLVRDLNGRKIYPTMAELTSALRVANIVEVEVMEGIERNDGTNDLELVGLMVNMADYTVGTNRGGEITGFDDFDIDYNQYKYLIETRMCGALTKFQSAVVLEKVKAAG